MAELLLDSDIRLWVFLPIVVITFLVGIIRHYVTILLSTEKKVELQQISDRYFFCYRRSFDQSSHLCAATVKSNDDVLATLDVAKPKAQRDNRRRQNADTRNDIIITNFISPKGSVQVLFGSLY